MQDDNYIEQKQADMLSCGFPAGTRITTDKGLKRSVLKISKSAIWCYLNMKVG